MEFFHQGISGYFIYNDSGQEMDDGTEQDLLLVLLGYMMVLDRQTLRRVLRVDMLLVLDLDQV